MDSFTLAKLLKSSGKRMSLDLADRLVNHPGELGVGREEIIRRFLRAYLPKRFDVSTGFAFDSKGNVSKQLDIIITNNLVCPRFETAGGNFFYPCESVVAVGQVRSTLTSLSSLRDALDNLESVKALDRSASGMAFDINRAESINHRNNHLHQIFTFLFVTGDSLAKETLHEELWDYILKREPHVWPNVVLAHEKYLATYCCDRGICANPMDARGLAIQPQTKDDEILMRFYLLLGQAVEVTRVSGMPYWEYLNRVRTWSADVFHSTTDDPPPYLRDLSSF